MSKAFISAATKKKLWQPGPLPGMGQWEAEFCDQGTDLQGSAGEWCRRGQERPGEAEKEKQLSLEAPADGPHLSLHFSLRWGLMMLI